MKVGWHDVNLKDFRSTKRQMCYESMAERGRIVYFYVLVSDEVFF